MNVVAMLTRIVMFNGGPYDRCGFVRMRENKGSWTREPVCVYKHPDAARAGDGEIRVEPWIEHEVEGRLAPARYVFDEEMTAMHGRLLVDGKMTAIDVYTHEPVREDARACG